MERTYWYKQRTDTPLFPELLWSRPENKLHAGKLLIIGGNAQGFSAVAEAFTVAEQAGVGATRIILPDALKKTVGPILENVDFAPTTPSGSFSQKALVEFLQHSQWADGVLLAGDVGRNSETAIVLDTFIKKYVGPLVITKDTTNYFYTNATSLLDRPQTCLVLAFAQLQKLAMSIGTTVALTYSMDLLHLIDALHVISKAHDAIIITRHQDSYIIAKGGLIVTTKTKSDSLPWRVPAAATAAVWWLQNQSKPLDSVTTAVYELTK